MLSQDRLLSANPGTGPDGLVVSSYRSQSRDGYLDCQEFLEDALFEFLGDQGGFDEAQQGNLLPLTVHRQMSTSLKSFVIELLRQLRIEVPMPVLDMPYLYAGVSRHLAALVFDTGHHYLAVFFRRRGR